MSTMFIVLAIWFVAIVAFVTGVALCAFRRIRMLESHIRAPLQEHIEQQEEKLRRVQDASAAHELFLAGLSHELRTPLSGIRGAVQLLKTSDLNEPQREYTQMIDYASATVLEMVDDMLTYSRTQVGKVHIESVPFNLREMIDDMLSLQTIKTQGRGIALIRDVSADVPVWLRGDRGKLNQVLLNLIGNAIKFTEEGSISVTVDIEPGAESVVNESDAVLLRFAVRDTGVGITADEIAYMFEPFRQGYAASHGGRQGTGLGLTICQRLLKAMGGNIQLDSVVHEGTCITFRVPLDRAADPAASALVHDRAVIGPLRSLIVLVVEDDEINRLVCTRYLALAGHHPVAAADERQVQHLMSYSEYTPDVILMDVNLAGNSGIDVALRMKQEPGHWQNVPVIAMSADVSGAAHEQAMAAGISLFLPKPFNAEQLSAALGATVLPEAYNANSIVAARSDAYIQSRTPDDLADNEVFTLDHAWLEQEIEVLGTPVLFELLNIFRASSVTTLQAMDGAVRRHDWQATADALHRLQGSAANLGMQYVVAQARALQAIVLVEGGPHTAFVADRIKQLEVACHASADSVRSMLLAANQQRVALATQGHD